VTKIKNWQLVGTDPCCMLIEPINILRKKSFHTQRFLLTFAKINFDHFSIENFGQETDARKKGIILN
jgi:hypothetical protein